MTRLFCWLIAVSILPMAMSIRPIDVLAQDLPPAPASNRQDPLPKGVLARVGSPRLQHGRSVTALRFSKDGKRLFSASDDFTMRIWDTASGQELRTFATDTSRVIDFSLSADESLLAVATHNAGARVWEIASGKQLKQLGDGAVGAVAISPDGKTVYTGEGVGLRAWDVASGMPKTDFGSFHKDVRNLDFTPDGQLLVGSSGPAVFCWSPQSGKLKKMLASGVKDTETLDAVACSADGRYVAAACGKLSTIFVWDASSTERIKTFSAGKGVSNVAFAADGKTLLAGGGGSTLDAWDWQTETQRAQFQGHSGLVNCVAVAPDGATAATGGGNVRQSWDYAVRLWDVATGEELPQSRRTGADVPAVIALTPDGKHLVAGCSNKCLAIWDVAENKLLHRLERPGAHERVSMALSPDGKRIASGGEQLVRLWNLETGEPAGSLPSKSRSIRGLSFTPDGKRLAGGTVDGYLMVWNVAEQQLLYDVQAHTGEVWSVDVSPDGKYIVTGGFDGSVAAWFAESGQPHFNEKDHSALVHSVKFSADGMRIASGSDDQQVILWETETGEAVRKFDTGGSVTSVAFCGRDRVVVSGHHDDRLNFWDVATGEKVDTVHSRPGPHTTSLFCPPAGRTMLAGGSDSVVRVWDLTALPKKLPALERVELTPEQFASDWESLAERDAAAGDRVIWKLVAAGPAVVTRIGGKLQPDEADKSNFEKIRRLIVQLDDDEFRVRENASLELSKLGPSVLPLLQRELATTKSVEVRFRIGLLTRALRGENPVARLSGDDLQAARAIQILTHLDTPAARKLLESIAQAVSDEPRTLQARTALELLRQTE